ncbi:hypothetical protein PPACK8108_LOCUS9123 [Phakopsora pachyrhizi]|uniref:Uncharacterized protein n=1 Tax=Phakopsora pachyrhizi TaxID=170000 RepID=A0AAV0AXS1_PHAPC|nr:hypothetical protein PPACK8108_LOCUS9123 [Phakopsora pachyrhizi]
MQAVKECPESVKQNCPADRVESDREDVAETRCLKRTDAGTETGLDGPEQICSSQSQVRMMSYESIKGEETDKEEDNYEGIIEETDTCFESAQNHSILAHHLTASMVVPIDPGLLGLGPKVFEAG